MRHEKRSHLVSKWTARTALCGQTMKHGSVATKLPGEVTCRRCEHIILLDCEESGDTSSKPPTREDE